MQNIFKEHIESEQRSISNSVESINNYHKVASLVYDIEEFDDVSSLSVYTYENKTSITCYLKESAKNSKLVHKLAQRFGVKFEKNQAWDKKSLVCTGDSSDGLYNWEVRGYIPNTCTLLTIEEPLTDEEIQAAINEAASKRTKTVTKVVCA